jgi:NAD(P)-dependent dehydrogenase (short-subunit alcohol dehydrogenase family)
MARKAQQKARKPARKRATRTGEKMGKAPPQRQTQPGQEYQMKPRPESQAREDRAAGKLRDQVALIPATFPEEEVAEFGGSAPMGRPGQPDEAAPCYVFLASDDSSYMTGQVLHPNGGRIVNA